jgi:raffinose/stachyose/melibiose transport system permease protein
MPGGAPGGLLDGPAGQTRPPTGHRAGHLSRRHSGLEHQRVGLLYVLAPLALYAFIVVVPFAKGVWISLHNWDGAGPMQFIGLSNFISSFTDPVVCQAFLHSLVIIVFYSAIPVGLGLFLAAVMARVRLRFLALWRAVLFLPQVISVVVVGVAWQWVMAEDGPFNQFLRALGLGALTRVWLGDFTWALPTEGVIGTWLMAGLCMVLFMAGAQSIDTELYDAANVDGAGPIWEFFAVTLPGLRNVTAVAAVLTLVGALNNFGLIWVTTQGGPGTSTQVMSTLIYNRAFVLGDVGDAAALAVLLAVVIMGVSIGISRLSERS